MDCSQICNIPTALDRLWNTWEFVNKTYAAWHWWYSAEAAIAFYTLAYHPSWLKDRINDWAWQEICPGPYCRSGFYSKRIALGYNAMHFTLLPPDLPVRHQSGAMASVVLPVPFEPLPSPLLPVRTLRPLSPKLYVVRSLHATAL